MLARCNRCGAEYTYSAFGGTYFGIGVYYGLCPECTKIVLGALKNIPKRYESIKMEVFDLPEGFKEKVLELHSNPLKSFELQLPWNDIALSKSFSVVSLPDGYTFSCSVVYQSCKYIIEAKSEDNIFAVDTKIYAILEYDLAEKKITGKPWLDKDDTEGSYTKYSTCTWASTLDEETIKKTFESSIKLSLPTWVPGADLGSGPSQSTSDP